MKLNVSRMSLGVATAATQIEGGGNTGNVWYSWYKKGRIKDHSDPSIACEHFNHWQEDVQLLSDLNIQIYRFGIEWSRIQPDAKTFDESAIKHYRNEILLLKDKGIEPLLTLHHFNNPIWFEKMGGFETALGVDIFLNFISHVIDKLGDIVSEYITINEPNVYVTNSYFFGLFPPGKKNFRLAMRVFGNLAACHIRAYELIHDKRKAMGFSNTKVSIAQHLRVFEPKNQKNPYHVFCANLMKKFFQTAITKAMLTGHFSSPIKKVEGIKPGKYYDFIGINYYSRSTVSRFADGVRKDCAKNDLGWEIYPQGIAQVCEEMYQAYGASIYITENGTCDNQDAFRAKYIYDHIAVLVESGLPVERYYHWCFTDNFEWLEGNSARFGLVHIDYETQERTVKQSGLFFSEMIRNAGVTDEMYRKYIK